MQTKKYLPITTSYKFLRGSDDSDNNIILNWFFFFFPSRLCDLYRNEKHYYTNNKMECFHWNWFLIIILVASQHLRFSSQMSKFIKWIIENVQEFRLHFFLLEHDHCKFQWNICSVIHLKFRYLLIALRNEKKDSDWVADSRR